MSPLPCPISAGGVRIYRDMLGAKVSAPQAEPEHGVTVVFVELAQHQDRAARTSGRQLADQGLSRQESLRAASITSATRSTTSSPRAIACKTEGARVLGDGKPKIGAHGKPVLFLHPKDFCGTLVELEQA